jgi:arginine deiminase
MTIELRSEVGRLRRVLVHEPGAEVDLMVPALMEELLYDDILFGEAARDEHRLFCGLMQALGIEVLQVRTLLAEALAIDEARRWLLQALVADQAPYVRDRMENATPGELAGMAIRGIRYDASMGTLAADDLFELTPLPNFCFQRDPQFVVGNGVLFCSMATATRWREALLSRVIFGFHPSFADAKIHLDPMDIEQGPSTHLGLDRSSFEGGDLMALSKDVIAMGYSERSNRAGVRRMARALAAIDGGPRWLVVVALPQHRAYMHLDTVFTVIDRGSCLVYPQVVMRGHVETAEVFLFDLHAKQLSPERAGDLLPTLKRLGIALDPIYCGGDDPITQAREQWTDGANALALAPGVAVLYDRNVATAEMLSDRGYQILDAVELRDGRETLDLDAPTPTCILLPSNELSRARGGPHCLTHALQRDSV